MMNVEQYTTEPLFGLDKEFLLKNQLLQILDNSSNYLTFKEIAHHFRGISIDVLQQTCRKIQSDFLEWYSVEECELVIHPQLGARLLRKKIPFKALIDAYACQELSYTLLQELFRYRELIASDFYENQHVSESTLRRKIKRINQSLAHYNLRITFAYKIKLTGSELAIRSFYFYFLFLFYRQLPAVPGIAEQGFFESKAIKIQNHLGLTLSLKELGVFSLIYYVHEHGVHSGTPLRLTEKENELFHQFDFPPKPNFLNNWSFNDWQFFLLFTMATDLFEQDFDIATRDVLVPLFVFESLAWGQAFKMAFGQLTSEEQALVHEAIQKSLVLSYFISIDDEFFRLFQVINFEAFQQQNPLFYQRFEQFWNDFRFKVPALDSSSFKFTSLMLASYFSPLDTQLYSVKIAVYSEVSSHFSYYLANRLKSQFKTKYDFVFITDFQQADLIITTFKLPAEECYETPQIIIDPVLTSNDLLLIDQWIEKMIVKESDLLLSMPDI